MDRSRVVLLAGVLLAAVSVRAQTTDPSGATIITFHNKTSTVNRTTTPLSGNASFTGTWEDVQDYGAIAVTALADQSSAANGLMLQFSSDGVNVDVQDLYTLAANVGQGFTFAAKGHYFRIKLTNGSSAQSILRIATVLRATSPVAGSTTLASETTLSGIKTGTDKIPASPATDRTTAAGPYAVELSDGAAFYTGAKTGQLPAALDGSGLLKTHEQGTATVTGAGGTFPVTGTFWQATQPVSGTFWQATQPVSGAFWQATQPISGTVTANAGTNLNTSALALDATLTGGTQKTKIVDSGGTNVATVSAGGAVKVDGSAATQPVSGTVAVSGNVTVVQGTGSNLKVDGSGVTQPVSGTVTANAGTGTFGVSGTVTANQGGTWTVQPGNTANTTAWKVDGSATTQPVSGTVAVSGTVPVSAAALPLPSGAAQDTTLTGGTTKVINRGGAKGATVAADVTSTAEGADHQALDVQIMSGGAAKDPTQIRTLTTADAVTATLAASSAVVGHVIVDTAPATAVTNAGLTNLDVALSTRLKPADTLAAVTAITNVVHVDDNAGSLTVDAPVGTPLFARLSDGAAALVGQKTGASSLPVVIASDQSAVPVSGTVTTTPPANASTNLNQVAGSAVVAAATGVQKVGVSGNAGAAFDAANNAAAPANVLVDGAETATQTSTQPAAATAGNVRRIVASTDGVLFVKPGGPVQWSCGLDNIGATLTQCQAAPAAGLRLYVTDVVIASTTATAGQFLIRYGTGANCVTGTTSLLPSAATVARFPYPANTSAIGSTTLHLMTPVAAAAANAVCILCVATNTCTVQMTGYTAP